MNQLDPDYMKYWRVVRQYFMSKYKISYNDLDMIMFLYSEKYFTRKKFNEFNSVFPFEMSRFYRLIKEGHIEKFKVNSKTERAMYCLSEKSRRMVKTLYKKLNGEPIPTDRVYNPLFGKVKTTREKKYREAIERMNKSIKQQQDLFLK